MDFDSLAVIAECFTCLQNFVVFHKVNCQIHIAVVAWLCLTVQFSVGGNYNSSFLHKSSPTSLNFTELTKQTNYYNYNWANCGAHISVGFSLAENVTSLKWQGSGYLDVFTQWRVSGEPVSGAMVSSRPGGTLLLPVNTVARAGRVSLWGREGVLTPQAH